MICIKEINVNRRSKYMYHWRIANYIDACFYLNYSVLNCHAFDMPFYCNLGGKLSVCMYSWSIKNYERKNGFAFCFCAKKKNERNLVTNTNRCTSPPPHHTHAWFISSICVSPWALLAIEVNVLLLTIFKQRSKSCKLLYQYLKRHNSGIQLLSVAICYCTLIILHVVPEVFICEY